VYPPRPGHPGSPGGLGIFKSSGKLEVEELLSDKESKEPAESEGKGVGERERERENVGFFRYGEGE
jgi:hypothetical protein